MKTRVVKLGEVGVDSAQLMICDPCYINSEWQQEPETKYSNHAHEIYKHKDGSLWQFCYEKEPFEGANKFPGSYQEVIPKYGKSPNQLIASGEFTVTDIDPTPHIQKGRFSYEGICKTTLSNLQGGQLNYKLGHPGVAVAFRTGFGDGVYPVYAEIVDIPDWGERIVKVWVDFFSNDEEE